MRQKIADVNTPPAEMDVDDEPVIIALNINYLQDSTGFDDALIRMVEAALEVIEGTPGHRFGQGLKPA